MAGNDKADASLGLNWKGTKIGGVQRNFFFESGQIDRYWSFMTSPGPECTCAEPEKRRVWLNGDSCSGSTKSAGKVTGEGRFAICPEPDIIQKRKIVVLF